MALVIRQVEIALGMLPEADGTISIYDCGQVLLAYTGIAHTSLGGTLTPTGVVARALTAYRSLGGGLTPTGAVARALTAYRALGGGLTPTGALIPGVIYVEAVGGTLTLSGDVVAANPAWLLMDEDLRWMGEWLSTTSYDLDDVVLYKSTDGNEWHVFISKASHNVNNIPTSTAAWWRRLYQEPLE